MEDGSSGEVSSYLRFHTFKLNGLMINGWVTSWCIIQLNLQFIKFAPRVGEIPIRRNEKNYFMKFHEISGNFNVKFLDISNPILRFYHFYNAIYSNEAHFTRREEGERKCWLWKFQEPNFRAMNFHEISWNFMEISTLEISWKMDSPTLQRNAASITAGVVSSLHAHTPLLLASKMPNKNR